MAEPRVYPLKDADFGTEISRFEPLCQFVLVAMAHFGYPPLALADAEPLAEAMANFIYGPELGVPRG